MKRLFLTLIMVLALAVSGWAYTWEGKSLPFTGTLGTSMTNSSAYPGFLMWNGTGSSGTAYDSIARLFIPASSDFCTAGSIKDMKMYIVSEEAFSGDLTSGNATYEVASTRFELNYRKFNADGSVSSWVGPIVSTYNATGATGAIPAGTLLEIPFHGQITGGIEPGGGVEILLSHNASNSASNATGNFTALSFTWKEQKCINQ